MKNGEGVVEQVLHARAHVFEVLLCGGCQVGASRRTVGHVGPESVVTEIGGEEVRPSISEIPCEMTNEGSPQELFSRFPLARFYEHVSTKHMWFKGGGRTG